MKLSFIWLNGYCYYHKSCSKCPTLAPTHARRRRHHSSMALSMTAAAKHAVNAAITFMILTVWTPIINQRTIKLVNSKFAHGFIFRQLWKLNWFMRHFLFAFSSRIVPNLKFQIPKGNILKVWWEIIHAFCWKFPSLSSGKNLLRFDEVTAMSLVAPFYVDTVYR